MASASCLNSSISFLTVRHCLVLVCIRYLVNRISYEAVDDRTKPHGSIRTVLIGICQQRTAIKAGRSPVPSPSYYVIIRREFNAVFVAATKISISVPGTRAHAEAFNGIRTGGARRHNWHEAKAAGSGITMKARARRILFVSLFSVST